jgi:HEXXH motif-containing protein
MQRPDPSTLAWDDRDLFSKRHEKSASALIAVHRALARDLPLGGAEREFLSLYERAVDADPEVFTRVWTDPTAYFWVRIAYQLTATVVADAPLPPAGQAYCQAVERPAADDALAFHLGTFKRFSLALSHLAGEDRVFDTPLAVRLPFALPGTRLSLRGEGEAEIHGLAGGALEVRRGGETLRLALEPGATDGVSVYECPLVAVAGCEVRLQADAYNGLPGLAFVDPVLDTPPGYQAQHADLVRETLRLIEAHQPACFAQLREAMQIVAVKPLRAGTYTNVTHSDLPGAFVAAVIHHPYELADTFIHEFHHNRLFYVEEEGPFFDESAEDPLKNTNYYMPWRDDQRPLHGLLHAVYVHVPVWEFWRHVCQDGSVEPSVLEYARERVVRIALQLVLGVRQLNRYASFTPFGSAVFKEMERRVRQIHDTLDGMGLPGDLRALKCREDGAIESLRSRTTGEPLTVRGAVLEHVHRYSPPDQIAELETILASG